MPKSGLRTGRSICQVVLMEIPRDGRRFLMADTGICVQPTLAEKADILKSMVEVAQRAGREPAPGRAHGRDRDREDVACRKPSTHKN